MRQQFRDAIGALHEPAGADARIVSLVPSLTELLCDLDLASQLVGRTGFCIHPREAVASIPKVGGTKDVKLGRSYPSQQDSRGSWPTFSSPERAVPGGHPGHHPSVDW